MSEPQARRRRGGGRSGNAQRRGTTAIDQMPWRMIENVDRPTEPLNEEGVQAIHNGGCGFCSGLGSTLRHGMEKFSLSWPG